MFIQVICLVFAILGTVSTYMAEDFASARPYAAATYIIVAIIAQRIK